MEKKWISLDEVLFYSFPALFPKNKERGYSIVTIKYGEKSEWQYILFILYLVEWVLLLYSNLPQTEFKVL